ncbi:hypothetical protein LshimejAT787_0311660 [Lyophyllum shimeji]|uniref:Uncharacterized protein n=1 Tax=Lyophyllum shimeji TaxID=47721 RepID=A0A9P3UJE3_LYOSH|nr:hypothetical protein LshimejAT787_0311660 [Lyophyllum shimeji]
MYLSLAFSPLHTLSAQFRSHSYFVFVVMGSETLHATWFTRFKVDKKTQKNGFDRLSFPALAPPDVLLEIVNLTANLYYFDRMAECRRLSLVCRSLNDACGSIIFSRYRLDIRTEPGYRRKVYPPGSPTHEWDEATIKLRLAHLRSKAAFVRELTIVDLAWLRAALDPEAFSPKLMSELIPVLRTLHSVTSFSLIGPSNTRISLPMELWDWLVQVSPSELSLHGRFEIDAPAGQDLKAIGGLRKLSLDPYGIHFTPILDVLQPSKLQVMYDDWTGVAGKKLLASRDLLPLKPTSPKLASVEVGINSLATTFDKPVLDFSSVPNATIHVDAYFHVQLKLHIPGAWRYTKSRLQQIFAEDLSGFDVSRATKQTVAKIYRSPGNGWTPTRQDHIGGEEKDRQEAENMEAYYRSRPCRRF